MLRSIHLGLVSQSISLLMVFCMTKASLDSDIVFKEDAITSLHEVNFGKLFPNRAALEEACSEIPKKDGALHDTTKSGSHVQAWVLEYARS